MTEEGYKISANNELFVDKFVITEHSITNSTPSIQGTKLTVKITDNRIDADTDGDGVTDQTFKPPVANFSFSNPVVMGRYDLWCLIKL